MNRKLHIKKGDMVYVNAGNDKGKTGKVLEIITKKVRYAKKSGEEIK